MLKTLHKQQTETDLLPLVYSCSGCSSVAQAANELAVRLDREQLAEMSCIAGVGGDVPSFVRKAQSAPQILVIDGCPIHCAKRCLNRHGVEPTLHIDLSKAGVEKEFHESTSPGVVDHTWENVILPAVQELSRSPIHC